MAVYPTTSPTWTRPLACCAAMDSSMTQCRGQVVWSSGYNDLLFLSPDLGLRSWEILLPFFLTLRTSTSNLYIVHSVQAHFLLASIPSSPPSATHTTSDLAGIDFLCSQSYTCARGRRAWEQGQLTAIMCTFHYA